MAGYAIETIALKKKFGPVTAVNGLNLKIRKGELFGFLGPNGAGKTTTMRMLTTLTPPTEGKASVAGFDIEAESEHVRSRIGVVPQSFALFEELTPMENMWFIGELYSMDASEARRRSEELLKVVGLLDKKDTVCSGFSGGMKQRLSVAAGLLHTPEILFMDEPTTGLDPQSRIALRELTKKLNQQGMTIVYTTHDMDEADKLCDRIAIMDLGKIIAEGTPQELKDKYGGGYIMNIEVEKRDEKLVEELKRMTGSPRAVVSGNSIRLHPGNIRDALVHKVSNHLEKRRAGVKQLMVSQPTLEEVFINLTKKDLRD